MKNIIISIFILTIISCNSQKKGDLIETKKDTLVDLKQNIIEEKPSIAENSESNTFLYRLTYNESLKIPSEAMNDMPASIKTAFLKMIEQEMHYVLLINNDESKYETVKNEKLSKEINEDNAETKTNNKTTLNLPKEEVYKNFNNNQYIRKRDFFGKNYLISDKLIKYNWILKNESKKIGDFICKKAILKNKDELTIAWYTDQIPISEGPSLYYGLPGIIIKLDASDRNYDLVKIEKLNINTIITKPKNGIVINSKDFNALLEKSKNVTIEETTHEEPAKD